ncbi:MAG: gliding motility-associated C-terminal domain-containing protein [Cyclobacteriaceae bacterium]|nr:gliding motility-associated C-terminal domain-containing protein [Cyclobacteriaceae bacterium]
MCTTQTIGIELQGEITVYNALSANGDGLNDRFYIQYIDILPDTRNNIVHVFNRWGDLVWQTTNYDNVDRVFTGVTSDGKALPTGTYYYKISFAGKSKSGFISLKR